MNAAANIAQANSLIAILIERAAAQPDHPAYRFIGDDPDGDSALSYGQLLTAFVEQHRMKLPGKQYIPCYRVVK